MKSIENNEVDTNILSFFHPGVSVKSTYTIEFDNEAKNALWQFIEPILDKLRKETTHRYIEEVQYITNETIQATAHTLVTEKREWKAVKLFSRFSWKRTKESDKKIEARVKKDLPPIYVHIFVRYYCENGHLQTFPIPVIIRPDDTLKKVLHSLWERAKIASVIQKNKSL